ncbi:MAG: GIY-YIG nuclease family protein [Thermoplasmatota archaeon]
MGTKGAYLLLISLAGATRASVGALGKLDLEPGRYIYVGSALGGLEGRVARHFKRAKRRRWHIDHLLRLGEPVGATLFPSDRREECALAKAVSLIPGVRVVEGFGSSDCSCPGHLFFLGETRFSAVLHELDKYPLPGPHVAEKCRSISVPSRRAPLSRGGAPPPQPASRRESGPRG